MSLWWITPWNTYWSTGRTLGIPEALLLVLLSWLRSVEGEVRAGMGRTRGCPQSLGHIGHPHLSHGPPIDHRCGGHRKDVHNRQHLQVLETYKEG